MGGFGEKPNVSNVENNSLLGQKYKRIDRI